MFRSVKVRDYMNREVITLTPETNLYKAIDLLVANRVSGAPALRWLMRRAIWWACYRKVTV